MSLKVLEIRQILQNKRAQISSYHEVAEIYLRQNHFEKALEYLNIAHNRIKKIFIKSLKSSAQDQQMESIPMVWV